MQPPRPETGVGRFFFRPKPKYFTYFLKFMQKQGLTRKINHATIRTNLILQLKDRGAVTKSTDCGRGSQPLQSEKGSLPKENEANIFLGKRIKFV